MTVSKQILQIKLYLKRYVFLQKRICTIENNLSLNVFVVELKK